MDAARWQQIQTLFHRVVVLPTPDGYAFLARECRDDPSLISEVLNLIEEDSRTGNLLDRGPAHAAHDVLSSLPESFPEEPTFGAYRISRLLGEGGMGVVYLAHRQDLGNPVAIKFLRDAFLSPARRQFFESEQRALAQLNHPHIAHLYDAGTLSDGTPWFVMEYIDGLPLTEYCRVHGCSIAQRLELFRSVCEAVRYAHTQALIHRDLKPPNILVTAEGAVKLLDFGIARRLLETASPSQTKTVWNPLTPAYAAPEQIRSEPATVSSDVYSLGVILYELLTSHLPFETAGRSPAQIEQTIMHEEAPKPSSRTVSMGRLPKSVWADLDVLCLTALHKEPARRYASVEALIRDIGHFSKHEPLEARLDSLSYRTAKFLRRNRRPVLAVATVCALIVTLVAFYTVRLTAARNAALAQAARAQRLQRFTLNLFQAGDNAVAPAGDLKVRTLLDRGIKEAALLNSEPLEQADLYQTLAVIYTDLGEFSQADPLFRLALSLRRAHVPANDPVIGNTLVAFGRSQTKQGHMQYAEQLIRSGTAIAERQSPPDVQTLAADLSAEGSLLDSEGKHKEAVPILQRAVQLASQGGGQTPELAAALVSLASSEFYLGHYDESDALNRRALRVYQNNYGDGYPLTAEIYINLAASEYNRGRYLAAERLDRRAHDIYERWYGNTHPEVASSLTYIAQALVGENRLDDARATLLEALAILQQVYGPVHYRVAIALNELGSLDYQADRYDQAEGNLTHAAQMFRQVYGNKHEFLAIALSNLGNVYIAKKQYVSAERVLREAIQIESGNLPPDHMQIGITEIKLGRALLKENHFAEAQVHTGHGYQILKQKNSAPAYLHNACKDLVAEYNGLGKSAEAAPYQRELASLTSHQ